MMETEKTISTDEELLAEKIARKYQIPMEDAKKVILNEESLFTVLKKEKGEKNLFPSLHSDRKKIIYLHGLGGSKESKTGDVLQRKMPEYDVLRPTLPDDPLTEHRYIQELLEYYHPVLIVGSSLGGLFTLLQKGAMRIVVNPVMDPNPDLTGSSTLKNTPKKEALLKDGTPCYLNPKYQQEMQQLKDNCFDEGLHNKEYPLVGIFGDDAKGFFDNYDKFRKESPETKTVRIKAEHSLSRTQLKRYVVREARALLGKQRYYSVMRAIAHMLSYRKTKA